MRAIKKNRENNKNKTVIIIIYNMYEHKIEKHVYRAYLEDN